MTEIFDIAGDIMAFMERLFIFKRLHTITWDTNGEPPMALENYLKQRGIKVYCRRVRQMDGATAASVSVPVSQRRWAEEVVFVQRQKGPLCEILPSTRQRLRRGGYTSRRWSQKKVGSKSPLNFLVNLLAGDKK